MDLHNSSHRVRKLLAELSQSSVSPALEGAASSTETLALLQEFLRTLTHWNRKLDLTAARTEDERVDLFLADAVVLAQEIAPDAHVIDVGAGAGAPGFVLALLRPDLHVLLVEPLAKRTSFLRSFWAQHAERHAPHVRIERAGVEVVQARGETFDAALSRATFEPAVWLTHARPLLRAESPSSVAFLLHAKEMAPDVEGLVRDGTREYAWPLTHRSRSLTRYRPMA